MDRRTLPGWLALAWGLAFGWLNLYWSLGGRWLSDKLAASFQDDIAAAEPALMAANTIGGIGKIALGVLAVLALAALGSKMPRWLVHLGLGIGGALLFLYGLVNWLSMLAAAIGLRDVPGAIGESAAPWYLWLWEPLWMLGGALLVWSWSAWRRR